MPEPDTVSWHSKKDRIEASKGQQGQKSSMLGSGSTRMDGFTYRDLILGLLVLFCRA